MQRLEQMVLFPGTMMGGPQEPPKVQGIERLTLQTSEGNVEAFFLPAFGASDGPKPAVVHAHGNGEIVDQWVGELEPYRAMGIGVLLPEYRGYGRSAGTPSEAAIADDFVAFYDLLTRRDDVDPSRIVFHGRSLGGGAVCALARHRQAAALVLESTFTSVPDVARRWLVPAAFLANRFDNESVVRDFPHPVLILHGRHDRVIPYEHATSLARAAGRAKLITYECDHNDMNRGSDGYWTEIAGYLEATGVLPKTE
jgi:fermentation-respiration switch protein FrsA (DUF1100 family)